MPESPALEFLSPPICVSDLYNWPNSVQSSYKNRGKHRIFLKKIDEFESAITVKVEARIHAQEGCSFPRDDSGKWGSTCAA